jgi:hypothetical protein
MKDIRQRILHKNMTRYEFLQFIGGSALVLLGLGNIISLLRHLEKSATTTQQTKASRGFGSRKFGV